MKPPFLGSYSLHTDPLVSEKSCLSVSVSVCPFEDEMTRDISPRRQVDWVLAFPSCSVGHFSCFFERVVVVY